MIESAIFTNLSSEQYHAHKESLSRSSVMDFRVSPYHYWAMHLNPNRPTKVMTPALIFGQAFHTLILEPHLFENDYAMKPEAVLLKDVGRASYDMYKNAVAYLECSGKTVLSADHWDALMAMRDSLMANEKAKELIENAVYESSYFWQDEASGLMVKARPDILQPNMYIDLKTCDDASPQAFQRSMAAYGNHIQAAMVEDGVFALTGKKLAASINICVEKTYPYSVGIYIIDEESINVGRNTYKQVLLDLSACIKDNQFPDFEIQTIGLPNWAI